MGSFKIVIIGAGSFVFGPSMLDQALLQHGLDDVEIALVDPDVEIVTLMAGVGRRMAVERGLRAQVTAHSERTAALDGAEFVICSAARQIFRRFEMDCEIIDRFAPGHLVSEFGGIQGISYSLRQIALIEEIAADMRRLCPDAWLCIASNPLPRVTQAASECGIRSVGFCSVATAGYGTLWQLFGGQAIDFPYRLAQDRWQATMAGLNHFSWVIELRERATNTDARLHLLERLAAGATSGNPRAERLAIETGYLLAPPDHHTRDFLVPERTHSREQPTHGTPMERNRRLGLLRAIVEGTASWDPLLEHGAWERPLDLVVAIATNRPTRFNALNLMNEGQIPELPANVVVETPATADKAGPQPTPVHLPAETVAYCRRTAAVTDMIVRAARERSVQLVHAAVELDPTVLDKAAGMEAIDICMEAHADILPEYN